MPVDWNDRTQVEQALIKARNAGVSDEDFIAYAKEKRASAAGSTLQKWGGAGRSFDTEKNLNNMGNLIPKLPTDTHVQNILPYVAGAPGQALKEGADYLQAYQEGKPENAPTLAGAATRVGIQVAAPAVLGLVARGIGKTVGFAGPAMQRVMGSSPVQAAKTLYGRLGKGAEEQLGTQIATSTKGALGTMQGSALAKDAFVDQLDNAGARIPVAGMAAKLRGAISEAETFGSDQLKQAQSRLADMADEFISKHQEGTIGLGQFMTFKENLSKQLFRATNPVLRQKLGTLAQDANDTLIQELGPGAANHIKVLENATNNRLQVLRKVNKLFRLHPEATIKKAAGSEEIMRAVNELDGQMGTNVADSISALAAKKSFSSHDMPIAYQLLDHMIRIAGSSAIGFAEGGPAGFLAYLASSPPMRRQAAKLGLLLSTTSIPRLATSAAIQATQGSNEDTNK